MSKPINMITLARTLVLSIEQIEVPEKYVVSLLGDRREKALEESIKEFGFVAPVVVCLDRTKMKYVLIDGLHRLEKAKQLGMSKVLAVNIGECNEETALKANILFNYIKGPAHKVWLIKYLCELAEKEDAEKLAKLLGRTKRFVYYLRDIKRFIPEKLLEDLLWHGVSLRFLIDAAQVVKKYYETVKNCVDVLIKHVCESNEPWRIVETKLEEIRKLAAKYPEVIENKELFSVLLKATVTDLRELNEYENSIEVLKQKLKEFSDPQFAITKTIMELRQIKIEEITRKWYSPPPEPTEVKVEVKQLHEQEQEQEVKPLLEQVEAKQETKTEEVDYASIAFEVYKKLMEVNKIIHKIERTEDREKQRQMLKEVKVLLKILVEKLEEKLK